MTERTNEIFYKATAGADILVSAGKPGFLVAIIIGTDVSGGIVEVSDHATDGDANVKIQVTDSIVQTIPVNAYFPAGITADQTVQTEVSYVWRRT